MWDFCAAKIWSCLCLRSYFSFLCAEIAHIGFISSSQASLQHPAMNISHHVSSLLLCHCSLQGCILHPLTHTQTQLSHEITVAQWPLFFLIPAGMPAIIWCAYHLTITIPILTVLLTPWCERMGTISLWGYGGVRFSQWQLHYSWEWGGLFCFQSLRFISCCDRVGLAKVSSQWETDEIILVMSIAVS